MSSRRSYVPSKLLIRMIIKRHWVPANNMPEWRLSRDYLNLSQNGFEA